MSQQLQFDQPSRLVNNTSTLKSITFTFKQRSATDIAALKVLANTHSVSFSVNLQRIINLIKPLKVTMLITAYIINLISQRLFIPSQNKLITH